MNRKHFAIAGVCTAAVAVAGAVVARKAYYKAQFEKGYRVPSKERGIAYYANEIMIASAGKITFEQILEVSQFVGGRHEYTEESGTGTYTFILLPERHTIRELELLGDILAARFDYVSSAGFHEVVDTIPDVKVDTSHTGRRYFVSTNKENTDEN